MKPIWFTEFGFPSIDKASNKPNVFFNPNTQDSGTPTHSTGKADDDVQRKALRATLEFWQHSSFVHNMFGYCLDARGNGWHKEEYTDSNLWTYGHWIKLGQQGINLLYENFRTKTVAITMQHHAIEKQQLKQI
jgi:hypothetical protein